jgi:hypothetical protein
MTGGDISPSVLATSYRQKLSKAKQQRSNAATRQRSNAPKQHSNSATQQHSNTATQQHKSYCRDKRNKANARNSPTIWTTQNAQPLQIQNDVSSTSEQEMRVSCGTGLLDLKHSTRCLQLSSDFDTSVQRQQQPHTRTQQSMKHRQNRSGKEEDSDQEQYVKTLHQQLPSSPVCFKSNTLLPCLRKLLFMKVSWKGGVSVWGFVHYKCASTYWKRGVSVWGFVFCRCASGNSLCRKLFEKGGVLWSVFRSVINSTDYNSAA